MSYGSQWDAFNQQNYGGMGGVNAPIPGMNFPGMPGVTGNGFGDGMGNNSVFGNGNNAEADGGFDATQLGPNLGTAKLGLQGLGSLASLWAGFQANALAKKQFNYTKGVTDTNLNNSILSYNTQLADRSRSRAIVEGQSQDTADAYVRNNSASRSY